MLSRQNNDVKKKYFNLRISERRFNKLRVYAVTHDKTMTQVIEELIDSLSSSELSRYTLTAIHPTLPVPGQTWGFSRKKAKKVPLLATKVAHPLIDKRNS